MSPDGEYEWFETIRAQDIPDLMTHLGADTTTDVLDYLERNYSDRASRELERLLGESGVPVERFVC